MDHDHDRARQVDQWVSACFRPQIGPRQQLPGLAEEELFSARSRVARFDTAGTPRRGAGAPAYDQIAIAAGALRSGNARFQEGGFLCRVRGNRRSDVEQHQLARETLWLEWDPR